MGLPEIRHQLPTYFRKGKIGGLSLLRPYSPALAERGGEGDENPRVEPASPFLACAIVAGCLLSSSAVDDRILVLDGFSQVHVFSLSYLSVNSFFFFSLPSRGSCVVDFGARRGKV